MTTMIKLFGREIALKERKEEDYSSNYVQVYYSAERRYYIGYVVFKVERDIYYVLWKEDDDLEPPQEEVRLPSTSLNGPLSDEDHWFIINEIKGVGRCGFCRGMGHYSKRCELRKYLLENTS